LITDQWNPWQPFSAAACVNFSTGVKGVYCLSLGGEIVYYGMSETCVITRIKSHIQEGKIRANEFCIKPCSDPVGTEHVLLVNHERQHGKLPLFNQKVG
jgi:hypothetical protein